jgi:superfamily II DNA or RNA helicase
MKAEKNNNDEKIHDYNFLIKCSRELSIRCDGAREKDGMGFNKLDSNFGKWVATFDMIKDYDMAKRILDMLWKYQGQLLEYGYDITKFELPALDVHEEMVKEYIDKNSMSIDEVVGMKWGSERFFIPRKGPSAGMITSVKTARLNGAIPQTFWNLWKVKKPQLKDLGISVGKNRRTGAWEINMWTEYGDPSEWGNPTWKDLKRVRGVEDLEQFKKYNQESLQKAGERSSSLKTEGLLSYQYPHERKIAKSILRNGVVLDASDTGTGKTYTALAVCKELGLKPIVVCPLVVIKSWKDVAKHFDMEDQLLVVSNYESVRVGKMKVRRPKKWGGGFIIESKPCPYIHVEKNEKRKNKYDPKYNITWKVPEDSIIIFDEAHRCKNRGTINTQLLIEAKKCGCKIMMLSATIAENPMKLYAIGYALGFYDKPHYFYGWAKKFGCEKTQVSRNASAWGFHGTRDDILRLNKKIFPEYGSRMRISEIEDFPESQIDAQAYYMNSNANKIAKIYDEMSKEIKKLNKKMNSDDFKKTHLTIRQKKMQKVEILKVPTFVELASDYIESGNSVAIFVNFKETVSAIKEKLEKIVDYEIPCITGSQDQEKKDENIDKFQTNKSQLIICNVRAAGLGLSLHDLDGRYPRVSLIMPTDSAQDLKQVLGRVHRSGAKSKSLQRIVFCADTIEEKIMENVKGKLENISTLNDGDLATPTL